MPRNSTFKNHLDRYERWFSKYRWPYEAELKAVRSLLPCEGRGVEVGVGTGRFAAPLGVPFGVEPVFKMAERARALNQLKMDMAKEPLS